MNKIERKPMTHERRMELARMMVDKRRQAIRVAMVEKAMHIRKGGKLQ